MRNGFRALSVGLIDEKSEGRISRATAILKTVILCNRFLATASIRRISMFAAKGYEIY
jgi:hypothetical protein